MKHAMVDFFVLAEATFFALAGIFLTKFSYTGNSMDSFFGLGFLGLGILSVIGTLLHLLTYQIIYDHTVMKETENEK